MTRRPLHLTRSWWFAMPRSERRRRYRGGFVAMEGIDELFAAMGMPP